MRGGVGNDELGRLELGGFRIGSKGGRGQVPLALVAEVDRYLVLQS